LKRFLVPFFVVDAIFVAGIVFYFLYVRKHAESAGAPDIHVVVRHPEANLTEIDLVNDGNAPGPLAVDIDVSWPDADLVNAKGLSSFDEIETGRRSLRFHPQASLTGVQIYPGKPQAVGWVKLTDDVPLHAEIVTEGDEPQP